MQINITFKGKGFLLIGDFVRGGAIATQEQYDNFDESYAYLTPNGDVMGYHQIIGSIEDIREIKNVDLL